MKARWFLIPSVALLLCACQSSNKEEASTTEPDNTGINTRDTEMNFPTSSDQSQASSDLEITRKIRRDVVSDNSFSQNAKNIKIITQNGMVILRGPVESSREKIEIEVRAKKVPGVAGVKNYLEITVK